MRSTFMILILLLIVAVFGDHADADSEQGKLYSKLLGVINEFGKAHKLTEQQTAKMVGDLYLNGPSLRKGGVGLVARGVFVVFDEKSNAAIIKGKRWIGKRSDKQEILITDGKSVLSSVEGVPISSLIMIIYAPTEIRFIDLSTNTGGRYLR